MSTPAQQRPAGDTGPRNRFRMTRAGVLNVWQYDEQVFDFAEGRLLLRGANGAGKSKTMEMLLPFVIDGDKARLTASGRHHTSLLWLMLDGYDGMARTGYLWVEFQRPTPDGTPETVTCGVGLRATKSARAATPWFFTSPRRVGIDLQLENDAGPLSSAALKAEIEQDGGLGLVFDNARRYREHVGALLFGLALEQYEQLLRLIYWLRQPQVGEEIDPQRLAVQLVHALPSLDAGALESAGATFDELQAFGEQIDRRERAAAALTDFLRSYAGYARSVIIDRGQAALDAAAAVDHARRQLGRRRRELDARRADLDAAIADAESARARRDEARQRISALEDSEEARSQQRLIELGKRVELLAGARDEAARLLTSATLRAESSAAEVDRAGETLAQRSQLAQRRTVLAAEALLAAKVDAPPAPAATGGPTPPDWRGETALTAVPAGLAATAQAHATWVEASGRALGSAAAALEVVKHARTGADQARAAADAAREQADSAEQRAEMTRVAAAAARERSEAAETELLANLTAWHHDEGAVPFAMPDLTRESLAELEGLAAQAAAPELERFGVAQAQARLRGTTAGAAIDDLTRERRFVLDQADPIPPPPTWRRERPEGLPGAPLWRLVDFRPEVADAQQRAALEAALDGAGLLDAWVTPDGRVVDLDRDDVLLRASAADDPGSPGPDTAGASATLADALIADPGASGAVPAEVVRRVLREVGLGADEAGTGPAGRIAVGTDGRWSNGPLRGRTGKPLAQYVGASARAAERQRRLAEIDRRIAEQEGLREAARVDEQQAEAALRRIRRWLAARPRYDDLLGAWATEAAAEVTRQQAESEAGAAAERARQARDVAASRQRELTEAAQRHGLPTTWEGLSAQAERIEAARGAITALTQVLDRIPEDGERWSATARRAKTDAEDRAERTNAAGVAEAQWRLADTELTERRSAQGAGIAELERRLAEQRAAATAAGQAVARHTEAGNELRGAVGRLEQQLADDEALLAEAEPRRDAALDAMRRLHDVPGLVAAAEVGADPARPPADPAAIAALVGAAGVAALARANDVLKAMTDLASGPAAVVEPRLMEQDECLATVGRDESVGDLPLPELTVRLVASVTADRGLLTQRERDLFERHVLGQLGDALRAVRRQADELVSAMNAQLSEVSTSQGISVRLRWQERDDLPSDARRALDLLRQPHGALMPGEQAELRDAMHRLIELARAEAPEESYAEHLARALDYREWFAFTVQYRRPEEGGWRDLQRRSPLSQGEQKVLCYLPLFAAAAAHFTSLAGAAPHAPRFVLLDDAFPKIDARTHPLLFGLLVELDLDFVVTSERLWGTHATVPSLAIYEALRSPTQRGIAQYEHRWDGHQLVAVGAGG